jgi:AcrR family transcriptional regulator
VTARVTRRRAETRRRLLDAALDAFAEQGFGHCSVEGVCERAGFTRGAFYSNFVSLDELFLAMWEERSAALRADVEATLQVLPEVSTVRDVVEHVALAVPVDDTWYRVSAEFSAHALRQPDLRHVVAAREDAIVATLIEPMVTLLARAGRVTPDPRKLCQALVAVHDGTAMQCLLDPDNPQVWERRLELFEHVVTAYTTEGS